MSKVIERGLAAAVDSIFGGEPIRPCVHTWLNTGYPSLNKALSGSYRNGLPCGRIAQIYGDYSSGKTVISVEIMKAAQRQGGLALFMDHERSFMRDLAEKGGLNMTKGHFSLQYPDTYEESITKAIKWAYYIREYELISEDAPLVVVFDSLASMVPMSKADKNLDELKMNDKLALAAATAATFPALALHAEKTNCLMLFLDQIREDPTIVFGSNIKTSGGKSPAFYSSVRIALTRKILKKDGEEYGQRITAKVVKNKVSRPFLKCEWDFLFRVDGSGYLDTVGGTLDLLCELGVLTKKGSFIEWTNGKKYNRGKLIVLIEESGLEDELFKLIPED